MYILNNTAERCCKICDCVRGEYNIPGVKSLARSKLKMEIKYTYFTKKLIRLAVR